MARWARVAIEELEAPLILTPERYDPRRLAASDGIALSELVVFPRESVNTGKEPSQERFLLVDAGDAQEGVLRTTGKFLTRGELGSTKRIARPGDVIISRLRPYLRQVAFIDAAVCGGDPVPLACSTEFYVLRSADDRSIAFLAAYLLARAPQTVFGASQEGGHHPRFSQQTLAGVRVPEHIVERRDQVSSQVEAAVGALRSCERAMAAAIQAMERRAK